MTETQIELLRLCAKGEQTFVLESIEEAADCIEFDRQAEEILELAEHQMLEMAFYFSDIIAGARHYNKIKVCCTSEIGLKYLQQEDETRAEKVRAEEYLANLELNEKMDALERIQIVTDIRDILEDRKLFNNQRVELVLKFCRQIIKADTQKKRAGQHASSKV